MAKTNKTVLIMKKLEKLKAKEILTKKKIRGGMGPYEEGLDPSSEGTTAHMATHNPLSGHYSCDDMPDWIGSMFN